MITSAEVAALVRGVRGTPPSVRAQLVRYLLQREPDALTWEAIEPQVVDLLDIDRESPGRRENLELLAALPVPSARRRLEAIAADSEDPDRELAARLVNGESLEAQVERLLREFEVEGSAAALEELASLPIEEVGIDQQVLIAAAEGGEMDTAYWAAIALARLGLMDAFDRVLAHLDEDSSPQFMWGDPWSAWDRIARVRPFPPGPRAYVASREDLCRSRDARLTVWAVTGMKSAEGDPLDDPDSALRAEPAGPAEDPGEEIVRRLRSPDGLRILTEGLSDAEVRLLGSLPSAAAGDLVAMLVERMESLDEAGITVAGNHLVEIARACDLGALPVERLLRGQRPEGAPRIAMDHLAFVLSRAPRERVMEVVVPLLGAGSGEEAGLYIDLLQKIESFAVSGAVPYLGAGPGVASAGPPTQPPTSARRFGFESTSGARSVPRMAAPPPEGAGSPTAAADGGGSPPPPEAPPAAAPAPAHAAAEREPPRTAYAFVDAPDTVVAEQEFSVEIGLSATQSAGVIGDRLVLPESTIYPYPLSIQLVASGFDFARGESARREVMATADDPYPKVLFRLRSRAQAEKVRPHALQVIYSIAGQTIGFAVRPIAVVKSISDADASPPPPAVAPVDIRVPTDRVAPDLTIHILRDPEVRERLLWTVESPHPEVAFDADSGSPPSCDIGDQPREFARQLVFQMAQQEGKPTLKLHLRGLAGHIGEKVPQEVWDAFHAAAKAVGGAPSVLLLSEEPYVPWELARVPDPLPSPDDPPFLGAQARVGRWILGQRTPSLPPPHRLQVASMAVVWGVYDSSKWARLEAAEEEAADLHSEFGATLVDAKVDPVLECLSGTPPASALHFAIHGVYNPGGVQDGLVLSDESTISPLVVSGAELRERPLVFLNACQVGSAQEVLGDYAGMASAFLDARASAVIAPLWSVKDTIAREISLAFYREAFAGEAVASVLRRQRAAYGENSSATCLAYQYFGHPELRLSRPSPPTT